MSSAPKLTAGRGVSSCPYVTRRRRRHSPLMCACRPAARRNEMQEVKLPRARKASPARRGGASCRRGELRRSREKLSIRRSDGARRRDVEQASSDNLGQHVRRAVGAHWPSAGEESAQKAGVATSFQALAVSWRRAIVAWRPEGARKGGRRILEKAQARYFGRP